MHVAEHNFFGRINIQKGSGNFSLPYPRVLDYSIFKSLLVPYSKIFTTRSSSNNFLLFVQSFKYSENVKLLQFTCNIVPNKMLQLQQCSSPCILLSIQLEIKNNVHEIKQSCFQIASAAQLHVALDDKQLLPLFRVKGDFEHLCQYICRFGAI